MSINAATAWRIRAGGSNTNGGGYDSTISGAGTDYTDQDSAQLTLTDLACTSAAPTTLTSATGGFTSAMVGNCIRIDASDSGTNFIDGYFFVTGHTDTNTVTIDRTCNNGSDASSGTGRLGGAFATFQPFADGGSATQPAVATPLAAGHTIYMRGSGDDDPSSADYDYSALGGYYTFPDGDATNGRIALIGYNGRPRFDTPGLLMYNALFWYAENLKVVAAGTNNITGWIGVGQWDLVNIIMDQNNLNVPMSSSGVHSMDRCVVRCTGNTGGGTNASIGVCTYGSHIMNSRITGKGYGVDLQQISSIENCVIHDCGSDAIRVTANAAVYRHKILNNRIHNCTGNGILISTSNDVVSTFVKYNIITKCGGYGIRLNTGDAAQNDRKHRGSLIDNNVFGAGSYANTSGNFLNYSGGDNDINLSSGVSPYVDEDNDDYNINNTIGGGASLRANTIDIPL